MKLTRELYESGFVHSPELCNLRRPSFTKRCCASTASAAVSGGRASPAGICDCCNAGAGCAIFCGPRMPSSIRRLCEFGFCRGTVHFDSRKPSFTSSFCNCCDVGASRATCLWTRKAQLHHRTLRVQNLSWFVSFGSCLRGPSFISRLFGCCHVATGRVLPLAEHRVAEALQLHAVSPHVGRSQSLESTAQVPLEQAPATLVPCDAFFSKTNMLPSARCGDQ